MQKLVDKITSCASVLPGDILAVGSFLNQQIDPVLMREIGEEISNIYKNDNVTKILTIEASGIAIAVSASIAMGVPAVFAKKNRTINVAGECYKANVHSYTHKKDYIVELPKNYLLKDDNVVIVDDFLGRGNALNGLIDIVLQSGATLVGCSCVIEKGFQKGGDELRQRGFRLESLSIIDDMSSGKLLFRSGL